MSFGQNKSHLEKRIKKAVCYKAVILGCRYIFLGSWSEIVLYLATSHWWILITWTVLTDAVIR